MSRRKTNEEFKNEIYELVGDEYTVIGEYTLNRNKIRFKHNKCGHVFDMKPNNFLNGQRCPKCYGKKKKNTDIFKKEVYELVKDEYIVLDEYKTDKIKIKFKHNKCGNIFLMSPHNFLAGQRCPKCYGKHRKTNEEFKKEVYELVGDEYSIRSKYINNKTKMEFKHNICGHKFLMTPHNFLAGQRCPNCFRSKKKTINEAKKDFYSLVGDEYSILSTEYINNKAKLLIKHNKCGLEFKMRYNDFVSQGHRCPYCHRFNSIGEDELLNFISTTIGHTYKIIIHENSLIKPYELDIYIPLMKLAIEYNGLYWHSDKVKKDKYYHQKKYTMCKELGINLIQIYDDDWLKNQDIVKAMLLYIFNKRKKNVIKNEKIIDMNVIDKNKFMRKNTILTNYKTRYSSMLINNIGIIAILGFNISDSILNIKNFTLSLSKNYSIKSVMIKFINYIKTNYPHTTKIHIDIDNNFDLYSEELKEIGFNYIKLTSPKAYYFNNTNYQFHTRNKNKLRKDIKILKIYDSGKSIYELKL
mgnify:CR=1 FL=1